MSADLFIDRTAWDLSIVDGGLKVVAKGPEVAQRVTVRLKRQLGEWFLNTLVGLPWFTTADTAAILGSRNVQGAHLFIRSEILGTDGVATITKLSPLWSNASRELSIYAILYTDFASQEVITMLQGA